MNRPLGQGNGRAGGIHAQVDSQRLASRLRTGRSVLRTKFARARWRCGHAAMFHKRAVALRHRSHRSAGRGRAITSLRRGTDAPARWLVLDGLPAHYADVLSWKYIEGRNVAEIGECLGIGQVAAQSTLDRARCAFRAALCTVGGSTAKDMLASMRYSCLVR